MVTGSSSTKPRTEMIKVSSSLLMTPDPPDAAPNSSEHEKSLGLSSETGSGCSNVKSKSTSGRRSITSNATSSSMRSSLTLRKQPVDDLLIPRTSVSVATDTVAVDNEFDDDRRNEILYKTCLRPGFTLSKQLMLSFGIINAFTITVVLAVCILVAITTADTLKEEIQKDLKSLAQERQGTIARYLAESLDQRLMIFDTVRIMVEATQDRFEGYPAESDDFVPYLDALSNRRIYPVQMDPAPLDWQLEETVNETNYKEFLQSENRWDFYKTRPLNAATAGFLIQGSCNPSISNKSANGFYENCTDANNDIRTGGVVAPSNTTEMIHRKSSDLIPLLRALFEARSEIRDLGIFFKNNGAGASLNYPQYIVANGGGYISSGCEWMNDPNPLDPSKNLGTQEDIDRCHPNGTFVPIREYNPMERDWCIDLAKSPKFIDAQFYFDSWNEDSKLLGIGKSIFDRTTKEFIGCSYVGMDICAIDKELKKYKVTDNSEVSIVRFEESGTILSSTKIDGDARESIFNTNLGLTKEAFHGLYHLFPDMEAWDPQELKDSYDNFHAGDDTYLVATHPMPPVPKEYDHTYKPLFLIVASIPIRDIQNDVGGFNEIIADNLSQVEAVTIVVSSVGFVVMLCIIIVMAHVITSPLRSMNSTANEIVNQFGDSTADNLISRTDDLLKVNRIAPKTELNDVVAEFNKMVNSFSGKAIAKSDKLKQEEVENIFDMRKSFIKLYESRQDKGFLYNIQVKESQTINPLDELTFWNQGSNLLKEQDNKDAPLEIGAVKKKKEQKTSPLFLWISVLIVVPLLLVTIAVAFFILFRHTRGVDDFLNKIEGHFLDLEISAISIHTILRADYVAGLKSRAISDLHLLTRYSSWLIFGGLNMTDSFTKLRGGIDECKNYSANFSQCPYVQEELSECDCDWDSDPIFAQCQSYQKKESRSFQTQHFYSQSLGADPVTGNRNATVYPNASNSPETTQWFTDQKRIPGFSSYPSPSGTETSYDRLRRLASVPIFPTLHNYDLQDRVMLTLMVAMEADGMVVEFEAGCHRGYLTASNWSSSESNGAFELRPELCPLGKYGYDPRCREWYDTGRQLHENNDTSLYVTSPYIFSSGDFIAQSATTSLIHPKTGQHFGQVLIDFEPTPIYEALEAGSEMKDGGFPVVITTRDNPQDTVIGPDFNYTTESAVPIAQKVLPNDYDCFETECKTNVMKFQQIVDMMKAGNKSEKVEIENLQFERRQADGSTETYFMAYAPVNVKDFQIKDSSNFKRGVTSRDILVYSLGLARSKSTMLAPFSRMKKKMNDSIKLAIIVVSVVVAIATFCAIYLSRKVASSVTKSMLYLLELIRSINRNGLGKEILRTKKIQASYEIVRFCDNIEILYKFVRSANSAFHAGELEVAYMVLVDALRLFNRLGNKKAVAVASNNLGNTLLGMYRELQIQKGEKLCDLTKKDMVRIGIGHFHTSIQMGEKAYDEFHLQQGWTPACLDFTQHLANRYFNRGLFLLLTKEDHDKPQELEALGNRDLNITRDMDQEVIAYGEDIGWGAAERIASSFDVNLVRLRGYNQLIVMGYEDEWNIDDLIEDTFAMVKTEARKGTSKLFDCISLPGRMQQVETELMKSLVRTGKIEDAAKVATRMLFEDELVFVDALSTSIEVLLKYLDIGTYEEAEREQLQNTLEDYHDYLKVEAVRRKQNEIYRLESEIAIKRSCEFAKSSGSASSSYLDSERLSVWTLKEYSGQFVTMEDF